MRFNPWVDWIVALLTGSLLFLLVFSIWNLAQAEEVVSYVPDRQEQPFIIKQELSPLDRLYNATGQLHINSKRSCSVGQISHNEYITAKHCITDLGKRANFRVIRNNSIGENVIFAHTSMTSNEDWAVLTTRVRGREEGEHDYPLELDCNYEARMGARVAYMGYPKGANEKILGLGYISSLGGIDSDRAGSDFLVDFPGNGGASGSPVIDTNSGKIIGVLVEALLGIGQSPYLIGVQTIKGSALCQ